MAPSSSHPSLRDLRAAAKVLLAGCRSADDASLRRHRAAWPRGEPPTLQRCLHTIAQEQGAASWSALVAAATSPSPNTPAVAAGPASRDPHPALDALRTQSAPLLALMPLLSEGGVLGIVGQSGCGKSFLAKRILLAQLLAGSGPLVLCLPWEVKRVGARVMTHADGLVAVARRLGRRVEVGTRLTADADLQVLIPGSDADETSFEVMTGLIAAVDAGAAAGHLRPRTTVYLDEIVPRHRFQDFATRMSQAECRVLATCQRLRDLEAVSTWTGRRRLRLLLGFMSGSFERRWEGLAECPRQPEGVFCRTEIANGQQTAGWEPLDLPMPDLVTCWLLGETRSDLARMIAEHGEDAASDALDMALRLADAGQDTEGRHHYANRPIRGPFLFPELVEGAKVWFAGDADPFTVQARNDTFIICTRPIPGESDLRYTVIDAEAGFRGTDGFVFPLGYDTPEACRRSLEQLDGISHRNRVRIDIRRVEAPVPLSEPGATG